MVDGEAVLRGGPAVNANYICSDVQNNSSSTWVMPIPGDQMTLPQGLPKAMERRRNLRIISVAKLQL